MKKIIYSLLVVGVLISVTVYLSGYFGSSNTNERTLYSLPSCASSDCDCGDFSNHKYAQWFHDNYDRQDKHRLDGNKDGVVCESLP